MKKQTTTQILLFLQILAGGALLSGSTPATAQMSKMWLNMESAQGAFSQTLLGYSNFTTNGIDYGYDGTLLNNGVIALYTKVGETKLVIQARAEFTAADIVPLHYRANVAGVYTIKLHNKTGVFTNGQNIYLRDNATDTIHDLGTGVYSFTATQGTTEGRFDIIYTLTATNSPLWVKNQALDRRNILAYREDSSLVIKTPDITINNVQIFDAAGRMLHEDKTIGSNSVKLDIRPQQQLLIINLIIADGTHLTRKVIH